MITLYGNKFCAWENVLYLHWSISKVNVFRCQKHIALCNGSCPFFLYWKDSISSVAKLYNGNVPVIYSTHEIILIIPS